MWMVGIWTQVLMLVWQGFQPLSHSSSLRTHFDWWGIEFVQVEEAWSAITEIRGIHELHSAGQEGESLYQKTVWCYNPWGPPFPAGLHFLMVFWLPKTVPTHRGPRVQPCESIRKLSHSNHKKNKNRLVSSLAPSDAVQCPYIWSIYQMSDSAIRTGSSAYSIYPIEMTC